MPEVNEARNRAPRLLPAFLFDFTKFKNLAPVEWVCTFGKMTGAFDKMDWRI